MERVTSRVAEIHSHLYTSEQLADVQKKKKKSQDEKETKYGKLNEKHGKPNKKQTNKTTDRTERSCNKKKRERETVKQTFQENEQKIPCMEWGQYGFEG